MSEGTKPINIDGIKPNMQKPTMTGIRPHLTLIHGGLYGQESLASGPLAREDEGTEVPKTTLAEVPSVLAEKDKGVERDSNPAMNLLQSLGLVYTGVNNKGEEQIFVDTEKISKMTRSRKEFEAECRKVGLYRRDLWPTDTENDFGRKYLSVHEGYNSQIGRKTPLFSDVLMRVLGDREVISLQDLEAGKTQPRKFLYYPKTAEEAFDIDKIKSDESYFRPWDLTATNIQELSYASETISVREAKTAYVLYATQFLDGQIRDTEEGRVLTVKTDKGRKPATVADLEKVGIRLFIGGNNTSAREFIRQYLPALVDRGLIKPEEFEITSRFTGETERLEKPITSNGTTTVDGKRYFIDRGKAGTHRVIKINEDTAMIVTSSYGAEVPVAVFDLVPDCPTMDVPKEQINFRSLDLSEQFPRRADENDEQYRLRLLELSTDFVKGVHVVDDIAKKAGISMYDFSMEEIASIAYILQSSNPLNKEIVERDTVDRIGRFAQKFGADGIKALLISEYKGKYAEDLLQSVENLKDTELQDIFGYYSKLLTLSQKIELSTKSGLVKYLEGIGESGEQIEYMTLLVYRMAEAVKRRSKDIMLNLKKSTSTEEIREIRVALKGFYYAINTIYSLFGSRDPESLRLVKKRVNSDGTKGMDYQVGSEGSTEYSLFRVFIRPKGDHNGVGRINFALFPLNDQELIDGFTEEIQHKSGERKVASDIRVGFDLDLGKDTKSPGFLSMDTARGPYTELSEAGVIYGRQGDVFGRKLAEVDEMSSHNYASFDLSLSDPDVFSEIANLLYRYFESREPQA